MARNDMARNDTARNIVVIGGGPAAVFAAIEAKKKDAAANVTLVTEESCEPYEKPPLSKAVLLGKAQPEDAPIAGPGGLAAHGVAVKLNTRCTTIDRAARQVVTASGALPYDALVIATGSQMRELPLLPPGMPRVHYLRTEAHARAIKEGLATCKHLVVIGAGLIGLEAAASAAELGIEVTVIEYAPRIMARACDEETGALILAEHRHHGVDFDLSTAVTQVTAQLDGTIALETSDGELYVADLVLVGTGVKPDDALAAAAGLDVQDGIVVDAQCRTSDLTFRRGRRDASPRRRARCGWRAAAPRTTAPLPCNAAGGSDSTTRCRRTGASSTISISRASAGPTCCAEGRRPLPDKSALLLETKDGSSYALGINAQRIWPRAPADRAQDPSIRGAGRSGQTVQRHAEGKHNHVRQGHHRRASAVKRDGENAVVAGTRRWRSPTAPG
jgi:NADPH-dependent 2,4-dienoyl-CoA reductase/sulfur reductase-like enzyme